MATLGGAQIADRESLFDSGGAFKLSQKSAISATIPLSADSEVEVCKDSPYVVGRIKGASDADEAFYRAYDTIQKGLDILSITGRADISTRGVFKDSLLWWRSPKGQLLKIRSVATMGARIKGKAMVLSVNGKPVTSLPEATPTYHESLRYFRLSQVAGDVFDSFRNMYLAFESLLCYLEPMGKEGWAVWLKRALRTAATKIQLDRVYPSAGTDVVEEIYKQLYVDKRLPIFHSKASHKLLPLNLLDSKEVFNEQRKLTRLYTELAHAILHFRHPTSWINPKVHDDSISRKLADSSIIISDSDSPLETPEAIDGPAYKTTWEMSSICQPVASEPGLVLVEGAVDIGNLIGLERIGRIAAKGGGEIVIVERLEAELNYEGIDILEIQIGSRFVNMDQTKQQFDTQ